MERNFKIALFMGGGKNEFQKNYKQVSLINGLLSGSLLFAPWAAVQKVKKPSRAKTNLSSFKNRLNRSNVRTSGSAKNQKIFKTMSQKFAKFTFVFQSFILHILQV